MRRPPKPGLVDLGLGVEHRRDHRRLRAKHRAEAIVIGSGEEDVLAQNSFSLVERALGYALKLSGGIEYAISAAYPFA